MSYQEKRTVVSILTGVLILVGYYTYTHGKYRAGLIADGDVKFWAVSMLLFIGIGIVAGIVIQIIFHILLSIGIAVQEKVQNRECDDEAIKKTVKAEMVTDEMDKLIELKSMKIGFGIAGTGFVLGLILLSFNFSVIIMLNLMFLAFAVGSLLEGFTQLYFYRKGV